MKICYIYTLECYLAIKMKSCLFSIVDATGEHYVEWNNPETERQISHVLVYLKKPTCQNSRSIEQNTREGEGGKEKNYDWQCFKVKLESHAMCAPWQFCWLYQVMKIHRDCSPKIHFWY
jgi:hypothetical protein